MKRHNVFHIDHLCFLKFQMIKKPLLSKQLVLTTSILAIVLLIIPACSPLQLESTPNPPTATEIIATATQIPPTATIESTAIIEPTLTIEPSPTEEVLNGPSPRDYVSFAYDSESNQIILFGGGVEIDQHQNSDETWAYDVATNKWTLMKPSTNPPKMAAATMAYDSESDRVILFGGGVGIYYHNETWAYDYNTNTWTKMSEGPAEHMGIRMVYDIESDRMILYGGLKLNPFYFYYDTWSYDYNTDNWTNMKPSVHPQGLNYQSMAYDTKADRVLLFSVYFDRGMLHETYNLWSYDYNANTWQQLSPGEGSQPLSRLYSAMAYDAESDQSVLFGGQVSDYDTGTWAYDHNSNTWQKMEPDGDPGNVSKHHMVYIPSIDRILLFGGDFCPNECLDSDKFSEQQLNQLYFGGSLCPNECQLSNELWSYDFNTNTWENITPQP